MYLVKLIIGTRITKTPRYGMTADGYTKRSGAPTSRLVRLEGEKRWRRLMVWQFSNVGTCFVRINGVAYVVRDSDLPEKETPEESTLAFRDLSIGAEFEFDHSQLPVRWSGATGPWVKTSKRCYKRIDDGLSCQVGTISVKVIKL